MKDPYAFEEGIRKILSELEVLRTFPDRKEGEKREQRLRKQLVKLRREVYAKLTPWETVAVARHPQRPQSLDYMQRMVEDFVELHGDRRYADDPAVITGFGRMRGRKLCIVAQQKGRDTKERIYRNFGQARPEGYRKAQRVMQLADRSRRPILCLIDTQGAYPGMDAEERGQAEAIATSLQVMADLTVPVVCCVIGEGGPGGALAIGVGNRVLMQQFAIYSVISPEGCASILWRDAAKAEEAAGALKLTAPELEKLGIVDAVVDEPLGGAHADPEEAAELLGDALEECFRELEGKDGETLRRERYERFRALGVFKTAEG